MNLNEINENQVIGIDIYLKKYPLHHMFIITVSVDANCIIFLYILIRCAFSCHFLFVIYILNLYPFLCNTVAYTGEY